MIHAQCGLGFHKFEWTYEATYQCTQLGICQRCGAKKRRTKHSHFVWKYDPPGGCRQIPVCERCDAPGAETRYKHEWSAWKGETLRCTRCQKVVHWSSVDAETKARHHQLG